MIYEAYQGKVLKVANVLKKIFKHMALIIGVSVAAVLLLISFFATKGMILEVGEVKTQISYGESMTFDVDALFSGVEYEYSALDDGEWSRTQPTLVGEYKVRAKSFGSFGTNKYTDEFTYSIVPKQIDVNVISNNVIYGETPKISAALAQNDKLECLGFVFEDITKKQTNVKADIEQITIYDENNRDVTSCYTINTQNKNVNITPRPIAVTVSSKTMEYNGTTLAFDGYEISDGTLAYSDRLGAEFNSSITDVGSVVNTPELKVRNADGLDVSIHYDMHISAGNLTVTQRPIVVVTPSDEKTYDGEKLENSSLTIYYGQEETTEVITETVTDKITEEETTADPLWGESLDYPDTTYDEDIWIEPDIEYADECPPHYDYDGDGYCDSCWEEFSDITDVDELPPEINIQTKPNYIIDPEKQGIIDGHTIVFDRVSSITDAGVIDNVINVSIIDENGVDKTANYSFFYDFGTLKVNKREVTVTTPDASWVYDGESHKTDATIGGDGIADGQIAQANIAELKDVDTDVENVYEIYDILDADGKSVIHNYTITSTFGTIEVSPRPLGVASESGSYMYDGKAHELNNISFGTYFEFSSANPTTAEDFFPDEYYTTSLVDGHTIVVQNWISLVDFTGDAVKNEIGYVIEDIYGNNVTENYDINESWGTIEITKRPITLSSDSGDFVYDGYSHNSGEIYVGGEYGLAEEQVIDVESFEVFINVTDGDVDNAPIFDILDGDDRSVINNYEITYEWGSINIAKRPLNYGTQSFSGVYDGYEHSLPYPEIDASAFDGMRFIPSIEPYEAPVVKNYTPEPIDNIIVFELYSDEDTNITSNFDLNCTEIGTLYLRQREITVNTPQNKWQYNGQIHSDVEIWFGGDGIADNNSYRPISGTSVKNNTFGKVDNVVTYEIIDDKGKDASGNYLVTEYNYGTLEVTPVYINVISYGDSWIYDGYFHSSDINVFDANSGDHIFGINYDKEKGFYQGYSAYGDNAVLDDYTEARYWTDGEIDNYFEISIFDSDGADSINELQNYIINSVSYGTLTIEKRPLTYATPSLNKVYNGKYQFNTNIVFGEYGGYGVDSLADGDELDIISYTSIIDVAESGKDNIVEFTIINSDGVDVSDCYELHHTGNGTLTITRRRVYYNSQSMIWEYDGLEHSYPEYSIDTDNVNGYDLVEGDEISFTSYATITNVGSKSNQLYGARVYSSERGMDVSQNYLIIAQTRGTLIITPRKITIKSADTYKVYDGQYITVSDWAYVGSSKMLLDGDYIDEFFVENGTQINADTYITSIDEDSIVIRDEFGNVVTDNYEITCEDGILTIDKLEIIIKSHSASKYYDGLPLTCHQFDVEYINGNAIEGHVIYPNFTGKITGVGIVDNTFDNVMVIANGNQSENVVGNYIINSEYGKLEIMAVGVGKLWSDMDGYEYVKLNSYGDYLGNGFATEPEYPYLTHDGFTPDDLASIALRNNNYSVGKQLFLIEMEGKMYFESISVNDKYFNFPDDIYGDVSLLSGKLEEYTAYEAEYREWVYQNYLQIDAQTLAYMNLIISANRFDASNYKIYDDVARFIQDSARYGFEFDPMLDYDSNIAVAFLSHTYGDQGVCRHYATAATMLYRALGIPARYTTGYLVKTVANQWNDVTEPGHAWVEVYIDGLGWIPVEVTAASDGFELNGDVFTSAGVGGINEGGSKIEITLIPEDMSVTYTGDYVYHNGEWDSPNMSVVKMLESQGYVFNVTIENEKAIYAGIYESYITDAKVYYDGVDVTYQFDFECEKGEIEITSANISIKPVDVEKIYDGVPVYIPQTLDQNINIQSWIDKGFVFDYEILGEPTDTGFAESYVDIGVWYTHINMDTLHIYDPEGTDVTESFTIFALDGKVRIRLYEIEIFLYRNQKEYDGEALDYVSLDKVYYSVRNQLPEGYSLERFDVYLSLIDVGYYTVEDLNYFADDRSIIDFCVADENGNDATNNFNIKFVRLTDKNGVEKDYIPMEITPRKLTITTASETRIEDESGTPLENQTFHIEGAGFADGQYIELYFDNACYYPGDVVANSIAGYVLYDKYGEVISYMDFGYDGVESGITVNTGNYEITFVFGTLELLPNDSDAE